MEAQPTEMLEVVVLPEMSEVHEQCIYIVPERIRQVNPEAYTPQVVSIGPFHHPRGSGEENNKLKPMEERKQQYLRGFLNRTNLRVEEDILPRLEEREERIRSCYATPISYNSNDFLKMIMTDACFIIELFLRYIERYNELPEWRENDPLLSSLGGDIRRDLILLENQLPFFVLDSIYRLADHRINPGFASFVHITLRYFQNFNRQNINPYEMYPPKHFTDLLRTLLVLPSSSFDRGLGEIENVTGQVYSASQLKGAGLVFKKSESTCLLDLKFEKGVLTMPCFPADLSTETYLRNILAFEKCRLPHSAYVTEYLCILVDLIKTEKDVSILVNKKIIVNLMGDANSVATMFNNLCKNIELPGFHSKHVSLRKSLNGFYENPFNKCRAMFIPEYFDTPVKTVSAIAAMLLLLLTLIQTIFSVCSYFKE